MWMLGTALGESKPSTCKGKVGGLVPLRIDMRNDTGGTAPWDFALEALRLDGAVILSGLEDALNGQIGGVDFRALAKKLPARLFASSLLSPDAPVNGVHDELREAKRRGLYLPGSGLLPHTDGYVYGDDLPDFVVLLCENPSDRGGQNALLDGQAILRDMEVGSADARRLAKWLNSTSVDLSETGDEGIAIGRPAEGPVVQWHMTASGRTRLKWRRQINVKEAQHLPNWRPLPNEADVASAAPPTLTEDVGLESIGTARPERYVSLWRTLPSMDVVSAKEAGVRLREFDALLQAAGAGAFEHCSFALSRGEALVVDNYRVLHARAPYMPTADDGTGDGDGDRERRMWRVWAWTSEGTGLPPDGAQSSNPLNDAVFERPETVAKVIVREVHERGYFAEL